MATPELLIEAATRHQVFLERLKSGEVGKFEPFLKELDKALRERLTAADVGSFQRERVERLLAEVDSLLLAIYGRYTAQVTADLVELGVYEAEFEARALNEVTTGSFEAVVPTVEQIRAAVLTSPLSVRDPNGGKLLEPLLSDWSRKDREMLVGAIRRGYFEGQTTQQILQTVRGTRARKYADGLLAISNRHAEAIVRTSVQHVASTARLETWRANSDLVTGYRWVSTLDGRTSTICRSLDGTTYKLGKGPVPPAHIRCRSTTAPVLDERFAFLREGATRASKGGPVDAKQTYYQWLKQQPAAFQDLAIGPERGRLLRDGGLSAERFAELQLDKRFQPLTLEEMRRLEPSAFERAGIK